VPDKVIEIAAVPYTLTGKKMEVPVRKLLMGWPLKKAASRDAMGNPEAIEFFIDYVATTEDYSFQG
jgi:acetoacetyl-CoA synthetase